MHSSQPYTVLLDREYGFPLLYKALSLWRHLGYIHIKTWGMKFHSWQVMVTLALCFFFLSYKILAPAIMEKEADPKTAAAKCLEEVGLDPESYRIGHTKARWVTPVMVPPTPPTLPSSLKLHFWLSAVMWVVRNTSHLFYSSLHPSYLKYNCNYVSCCDERKIFSTHSSICWYYPDAHACCWVHVALCGLPLTKQATRDFGQHLEVAKGSSPFQLDWMQFVPIWLPYTFCVQIQMKLNQQTLLLFQVTCFAVVPFIQASDVRTTSCYGIYSSFLLVL